MGRSFRMFLLLSLSLWLSTFRSPCWGFDTFEQVRAKTFPSESLLLDRNGEVIHETRRNSKIRQLEWTSLALISPALKEAVVLSEDQHFAKHSGVDWSALVRATSVSVFGSHLRGASTI